jgi:outer membrane protein OmpA-like peptidoglycan-associated protein
MASPVSRDDLSPEATQKALREAEKAQTVVDAHTDATGQSDYNNQGNEH